HFSHVAMSWACCCSVDLVRFGLQEDLRISRACTAGVAGVGFPHFPEPHAFTSRGALLIEAERSRPCCPIRHPSRVSIGPFAAKSPALNTPPSWRTPDGRPKAGLQFRLRPDI